LNAPSNYPWIAELNGHAVTRSFRATASTRTFLALLTGLKIGRNTLTIRVAGTVGTTLQLLNHPLSGPIFSGPHQEPFVCQTVPNGLGRALDSDCNARTVVQYYYKSTEPSSPDSSRLAIRRALTAAGLAPGFKVYDPSGPIPTDLAQTVLSDGRAVNYIVRREIGTINRSVYDIQFLHQPGQPLPSPWTHPSPGWNGRLVYVFEGGGGKDYHQGILGVAGAVQESLLAQGYAVATSTLNSYEVNSNDRVSAETLSMVKEHFIKRYGEPVHTIGWGVSGGAIQQYLIAQNYPGLLDGIIPVISFPDHGWVNMEVDCALLAHAFKATKEPWTEAQKAAVSGLATWRTCVNSWSSETSIDPRGCDRAIPKSMIYDRVTNPKGVRCDLYDNEINFFGRNPRTGFARRPLDNVGVQYGLSAFNTGKINAEQFIELNEHVGGIDDDGHVVPARTVADPEALRESYQGGLSLTGGGGLAQIPIIDWRPYLDDLANEHDRVRSFVTRSRLIAANGNADNQVLLVGPRPDLDLLLADGFAAVLAARAGYFVRQMDRWLDGVAADTTTEPLSAKIARDKPAALLDGCWATNGERIFERPAYDGPGRCNQMYPAHGDPRLAARAPLREPLKCALKPVSEADYLRPLTGNELKRLRVAFPSGVCDYGRPGIDEQASRTTWQRYVGSP
jgi:Tannase-like family of unknown function (DUF6351)